MNDWVELCCRALRRLGAEGFQMWMFIVGTSGTDEGRTVRGEQALRLIERRGYVQYIRPDTTLDKLVP